VTVALSAGQHVVTLHDASMGGFLALAVDAPPRLNGTPFYDNMFWVELGGVRRDWW
jgi:hypothetical protein